MPEPQTLYDHLQPMELSRVTHKIGAAVLQFCRTVRVGNTFRMESLQRYVSSVVPETAPDSPSRILRELRKKGELDYEVVKRSESLYRVTRV
jgi:hypothetical protein